MIVLMCSKYLRRVRSERTFELVYPVIGAPQVGQWIKNPPAMQETRIQSLSGEGLLEEGMSTPVQYPVFLPGDSHAQTSLGGCSPYGRKELDTTFYNKVCLVAV